MKRIPCGSGRGILSNNMNSQFSMMVYVSGHGFGHATRMSAVLQELLRICPAVRFEIRTMAPTRLFSELGAAARVSPCQLDVGLIQSDVFHHDLDATLGTLRELRRNSERLVESEVALGRE